MTSYPVWPGGADRPPPLVSASMVVDHDAPRRIARSAALGGGRTFALTLAAAVPGIVAATVAHHFLLSNHPSVASGARIAIDLGVLVAVVLLVAALLVVIVVAGLLPGIRAFYATVLPPGSTISMDYYADRMVATSAGHQVRVTPYASIDRLRVTRHCVAFGRGMGTGALPIEVVPPAALTLIRGAVPQRR